MDINRSWREIIYSELTEGIEELRSTGTGEYEIVRFSIGDIEQKDSGYFEIISSLGGLMAAERWLADGLQYMKEKHDEARDS